MKKFLVLSLMAVTLLYGCKEEDNKVAVTRVMLNETEITLYLGGTETFTLKESILPENATDKSVTWQSADAEVASVANGVVTAKKIGNTTIDVITNDGNKKATCTVHVLKSSVAVTGVKLEPDKLSLFVGDEAYQLTAIIEPDEADNKGMKWSSSNANIADVSNSGIVTAIDIGTATITVTTNDGNKTATCEVTVKRENGMEFVEWACNVAKFTIHDEYIEFNGLWSDAVYIVAKAPNKAGVKNYFYFEYQLEAGLFGMEFRFHDFGVDWHQLCRSAVFDNTQYLTVNESIDPNNEQLWKTFKYDLKEEISLGGILNGALYTADPDYGNWMIHMYFLQEGGKRLLIRNLKIKMEKE